MNNIALSSFAVLAVLSLGACGNSSGTPAAAGSASPAATASAASAQVSCDDVVAHVATLTKVDADGKKLFLAICASKPQSVRACMVAAATAKDLDACDPHPLKDVAAPAAAPGSELKATDLVDVDLSSADPAWKGWAAKGPKDGKVLADGVHGARIAAAKVDAFDISFAPTKTKLADTKKGIEAGQKIMGGAAKATYLADTADKLEWTTQVGSTKVWHFAWNVKVSGKDVTCSSGMMGVGTESLAGVLKASCLSLHKK